MAHVFRPGRRAGWRGWMLAVLVWSAQAARGAEATNSEPSPKTTPPANAAAPAPATRAPSGATGIAVWPRAEHNYSHPNPTLYIRYDRKPELLDTSTGAFKGKAFTMMDVSLGETTVLCTDGSIIFWDFLGTGNTTIPSLVPDGNMFAGRKIAAIAGDFVLCADGTLYGWFDARENRLTGSYTNARRPGKFAPFAPQFLAGRKVTLLTTCKDFGTAVCADGTRIAWGENSSYTFGSGFKGPYAQWLPPVKVPSVGDLFKKTIAQIAVAWSRDAVLALTTDGTLVAWGAPTELRKPVALKDESGLLKGKKITSIVALGLTWNIALCADGTVAAWNGCLEKVQFPDTKPRKAGMLIKDLPSATYPIALNNAGALQGKTVVAICNSWGPGLLLLCSDGTLGHWDGLGPPTAVNLKGLEKKTITFIAPGAVLYKDKEPSKP